MMMASWRWWRGILITFGVLAALRFVLPLPFMNEVLIFSIYTIGCNFLLGDRVKKTLNQKRGFTGTRVPNNNHAEFIIRELLSGLRCILDHFFHIVKDYTTSVKNIK